MTLENSVRTTLERLAPGTGLRDGLERILRGRTGALIVLGYDETVASICDGGFELDVPFAPTKLRELCKMDGAVVLSTDGTRIRRANVQLIPDQSYPTEESGTRHRAAERTSRHTGYPVISVSQSMNIITVYFEGGRHVVHESSRILDRANQALGTMEGYRRRLDQDNQYLFTAELGNYAAVLDVATVIQRIEMLRRIAVVMDRDVIELGTDGKQIAIQLAELRGTSELDRELIIRDYIVSAGLPADDDVHEALRALEDLTDKELVKTANIARVLGYPTAEETLTEPVTARGYRTLSRIPRVQRFLMDKLVEHFTDLPGLLSATVDDLNQVENVGPLWARHIHDGLSRMRIGPSQLGGI